MDKATNRPAVSKKLDELRPVFEKAKNGEFVCCLNTHTEDPDLTELLQGVNIILQSVEAQIGMFQDSEKMKEEFLALAAHQLRSPLSIMRWDMELLVKYHDHLPAEILQKIEILARNNKRMIDLVNDILTVSRIDLNKIVYQLDEIDLNQALQNSLNEFQPLTSAKEIKVTFLPGKDLPKAKADTEKLREIFQNIIGNALKFTPAYGQIEVSTLKKDNYIVMEISDSGIGIPQEELKYLGNKFYRASNAVEGQSSGTGLGLFITKKYINDWGGKLVIESPANANFQHKMRNKDLPGTSIYINLPFDKGVS